MCVRSQGAVGKSNTDRGKTTKPPADAINEKELEQITMANDSTPQSGFLNWPALVGNYVYVLIIFCVSFLANVLEYFGKIS